MTLNIQMEVYFREDWILIKKGREPFKILVESVGLASLKVSHCYIHPINPPCTLYLVPCTSKYQKMEMSFPWPPEKSLMYQDTWHLLYCWIHKVASSSWSKVFFSLKGQEVPASRLHEAAQKFSLSSSNTDLQSSITKSLVFTIVRHPFEHLVSTYRDKSELAKKYA